MTVNLFSLIQGKTQSRTYQMIAFYMNNYKIILKKKIKHQFITHIFKQYILLQNEDCIYHRLFIMLVKFNASRKVNKSYDKI